MAGEGYEYVPLVPNQEANAPAPRYNPHVASAVEAAMMAAVPTGVAGRAVSKALDWGYLPKVVNKIGTLRDMPAYKRMMSGHKLSKRFDGKHPSEVSGNQISKARHVPGKFVSRPIHTQNFRANHIRNVMRDAGAKLVKRAESGPTGKPKKAGEGYSQYFHLNGKRVGVSDHLSKQPPPASVVMAPGGARVFRGAQEIGYVPNYAPRGQLIQLIKDAVR